MAGPGGKQVYSIPANAPFADTLARQLWHRAQQDPIRLSQGIVLVPHRRAARVVAEAFLRLGDGHAMLLPEIRAVGDVDEDEPFGESLTALDADMGDRSPPAISYLRRVLLLTRLVISYLEQNRDLTSEAEVTTDQAVRLAADLARLLDQMQTARISFDQLSDLVPEEHAGHWQITLSFLKIVSEYWPAVLEDEGAVDPGVRRDRILEDLAERWSRNPPTHAVTVAGSTGTVPATAALMQVVSSLPQGAVVLPGIDRMLDDESWAQVAADPTHPQNALARLLDLLELARDDVTEWPGADRSSAVDARMRLLSEAMRPASTTERWRALSPDMVRREDLEGLAIVTCPTLQEEAGVIALMLREAQEVEGRTAALITPDRALGRRVKAELRRWDIEIDDSAGQPLGDTPPLALWRLIGAAVADGLAPVSLLTALKHPLASGGEDPGSFRSKVRRLERILYRGPRPPAGIDGLLAALAAAGDADDRVVQSRKDLAGWLEPFAAAFRAFEQALENPSITLQDLLLIHYRLVELLTADKAGKTDRFWAGDSGTQAAAFFADLFAVCRDWPALNGRDYLAMFDALISGMVFRPRFGTYGRLAILSPLEGRLQGYDRIVLGSLNEGSWPGEPAVDPWLNRPMRLQLGLPLPEIRIGQSAHDFMQACGSPEVFITRSERVDGTPAVPSRWLLRISAVAEALGLEDCLDAAGTRWRGWQAALDAARRQEPRRPPKPCPPVAARPRSFSVTEIATWQRNPYAIYARRILDLRPLDPLDKELGAAERGTFIHEALDHFVREPPSGDYHERLAVLLEYGRQAFGGALEDPAVWAFWWPRFERIAGWFVDIDTARSGTIRSTLSEVRGTISIDGPAGAVTLRAIADRLDLNDDNVWTIIDYKTGSAPSTKQVIAGWAPQLPLEGVILRHGGFAGIAPGRCGSLEYWELSGRDPAGKRRGISDADDLIGGAESMLRDLIAVFDDDKTPYLAVPFPDRIPNFDDFGHLARIKEWSS